MQSAPEPPQRPVPPPPGNDVRELMRYNAECEQQRLAAANLAKSAGKAAAPAPPQAQANEIHAILQNNLAHEKDLSLNGPSEIKKRKTRRNRDFVLIVAGGNALILGVLAFLVPDLRKLFDSSLGIVIGICALSGSIMLTAGATWVIYHVMDDY